MATHIRNVDASRIDDRIDILNRKAVEAFPAKQVFRTAGAILALVRVSAAVLRPPVNLP